VSRTMDEVDGTESCYWLMTLRGERNPPCGSVARKGAQN